MRNRYCVRLLLSLVLCWSFLGNNRGLSNGESDIIYVIPIKGVIDLGLSGFVERAIEEAKVKGAKALLFEIDTFGGRVDAAVQICKAIEQSSPLDTIAYITDQAWSAGALISLACRTIIMSPGSSIGSAEPRVGGITQQPTDEKEISAVRAKFKSVAEANGHSVNLAQAMVDKDIELKKVVVKGEVLILTPEEIEEKRSQFKNKEIKIEKTVVEKSKLLNLTAEEAKGLRLAETVLSTRDEVLAFSKLDGSQIVEIFPTWSEVLVRWLTHPILSSMLLTLGTLGILFELRMPGWGISGTIGLLCLALFFWGHYLVGLANWAEVVFFLLGVILLALEIFVIPGFGAAGISGIGLIVASIYLALTKHPFQIPKSELRGAFYIMAYSFIAAFVIFLLSFKFIPRVALWSRLVLTQRESREEGFGISSSKTERYLGIKGKTLTNLRPSGRALFGEEIVDVVTEGGFIEKDRNIKVVKVEGNKIIVSEET